MRLPGVLRGQLALGLAVFALGVLVLGGLKRLESSWKQDRHATLSIKVDADGPTEGELTASLQASGYEIRPWAVTFVDQGRQRQLRAECVGALVPKRRVPTISSEPCPSARGASTGMEAVTSVDCKDEKSVADAQTLGNHKAKKNISLVKARQETVV